MPIPLDEAVERVEEESRTVENLSLTVHEAIKAYRAENDLRVATLAEIDLQSVQVIELMNSP